MASVSEINKAEVVIILIFDAKMRIILCANYGGFVKIALIFGDGDCILYPIGIRGTVPQSVFWDVVSLYGC